MKLLVIMDVSSKIHHIRSDILRKWLFEAGVSFGEVENLNRESLVEKTIKLKSEGTLNPEYLKCKGEDSNIQLQFEMLRIQLESEREARH